MATAKLILNLVLVLFLSLFFGGEQFVGAFLLSSSLGCFMYDTFNTEMDTCFNRTANIQTNYETPFRYVDVDVDRYNYSNYTMLGWMFNGNGFSFCIILRRHTAGSSAVVFVALLVLRRLAAVGKSMSKKLYRLHFGTEIRFDTISNTCVVHNNIHNCMSNCCTGIHSSFK